MTTGHRQHTTALLAVITLLAVSLPAASAARAVSADETELWFPVELPVDAYADTWGAPRGGGRSHEGTDILAPQMRRVYAAADGEIIKALGEDCVDGQVCTSYYLAVAGDDGRGYFYVHLNDDTPGRPNGCDGLGGVEGAFSPRLVEQLDHAGTLVGTRVARGEHLGWVGSSGNAACGVDQLHFEIWNDHNWGATGKRNPYPELVAAETAGRAFGPDTPDTDSTGVALRDAGLDRIGTAVALSAATFEATQTVVLAPADQYTDALAAGPLAATLNAPVLLAPETGASPQSLIAEVDRLDAVRMVVVGPVSARAIQDVVDATAVDDDAVTHLTDEDPAALSVLVAHAVVAAGGDPTQVTLARAGDADAQGWPDALMASLLASYDQAPVLLTRQDELSPPVASYLSGSRPRSVTVVGGTAAISAGVVEDVEQLGIDARRLSGPDRLTTALAVTDEVLTAHRGATARVLHIATAGNYPDALAAGPALAARGSVLVLMDRPDRSATVLDWITQQAASIDDVHAIGGTAALPEATVSAVMDRID